MNKTWLIFKKEMRETFRDKKSLVMMLIIPLMIPLLVIGFSFLFDDEMNSDDETYKIGLAFTPSDLEYEIIESLHINATTYSNIEEISEDFTNGDIDIYITKENNNYTIYGSSSESSSKAIVLAESYLMTYKNYLQVEYMDNHGIDSDDIMNIITYNTIINEENNFIASYLTVYAFMFIIMAITVSATYPATDATAGEKERGTLETLLTFPIKSKDIIIGKFLSVSISSIITGLLGLVLMILSLKYSQNRFSIYEGITLILPIKEIIILILIIILYSLLISGLCIAIASKSKTFKEAQSALTPLSFISFFPGMIAYMLNIETTHSLALIPFLNYIMIFNDITNGNIDILNIILMFISTIAFIFIILFIIIKQYKSEKILFTN